MKRTYPILLAVLAGAVAASTGSSQIQRDSLLVVLPDSDVLQGWSRTDSARFYVGNDLYLFIDGGADLFFEYGFRRVVAAEYHKGGNESINLEIYEMNDAGAAFGITSVRSGGEAKHADIGQGGSAHAYYLMFWKGRFYVSIAASDSSAECRRGLEAMARAVDQNLFAPGQKPHIMELLPTDPLMKEWYFRGYLGLSSARVLDMDGMFPATDGAVGTYPDHAVIFLRYNSASEANQRLADITEKLRSDERFKGYQERDQMARVSDRRNQIVCFGKSGSNIIISVSSKEAIAESTYKSAITRLHGR
jgi:hypothetical protein